MKKIFSLFILTLSLTLVGCNNVESLASSSYSSSTTSSESYDDELLVYECKEELIEDATKYPYTLNNAYNATMEYNYKDLSRHYYYNVDYMPTRGDVNVLVIPVKFANYTKYSRQIHRQKIYDAFFGSSEETGWESVSSYYYKDSYGSLRMSGVVTEFYEAEYESSLNFRGTMDILTDAVEWYKERYNDDGKKFDSDGDGFIDAVALIYNAPAHYENNGNLWAYTYWAQDRPNISSPVANAFFWGSVSFLYSDQNISIDSHTYIHEFGHIMGLEDYYNYNSNYGSYAGGFSMQDFNVGDHDPFSKLILGWARPIVVKDTTTIELSPTTTSGQMIVLKPDNYDMVSPFDEYLIIEFYTPLYLNQQDTTYAYSYGYPTGSKESGIRLWHVDARLLKNYYDTGILDFTNTIEDGNRYIVCSSNTTGQAVDLDCSEFRLNKLLRKGKETSFELGEYFSTKDLFVEGDTFTMEDYKESFTNEGLLNSGESLGFSFSVDSIIKNQKAVISIVKE